MTTDEGWHMKNVWVAAWIAARLARWLTWAGFLLYSCRVLLDKPSYMDAFSRPLLGTETLLYGLPMLAITFGLLELMMRERAGIARPNYFRLKPPAAQ
jgi:hypothetical protein